MNKRQRSHFLNLQYLDRDNHNKDDEKIQEIDLFSEATHKSPTNRFFEVKKNINKALESQNSILD